MRSSLAAAAIVLLAGAGCTSVVRGSGRTSGTPVTTQPSTPASVPVSSGPVTPTSTPPPPDIARSETLTAIGDPVTADLCAAVGLDPLRNLGTDLTPSFDDRQYPPGCSITVRNSTKAVVGVSVYADQGEPAAGTGRTTRQEHGQTVYVYNYDSTTGSCERVIRAQGVLLTVDAYQAGDAVPPEQLACAGSDAVVGRLSEAVTAGNVPRLALADPSLSSLDACKIARKADVTALPAFSGGEIVAQGFGASCEIKPKNRYLFFNFVLAAGAHPGSSTPETVEGHVLYPTDTQGGVCSYVSTQGATPDGRHEQVAAFATSIGSGNVSPQLCTQTAQALARYLTAAGLP